MKKIRNFFCPSVRSENSDRLQKTLEFANDRLKVIAFPEWKQYQIIVTSPISKSEIKRMGPSTHYVTTTTKASSNMCLYVCMYVCVCVCVCVERESCSFLVYCTFVVVVTGCQPPFVITVNDIVITFIIFIIVTNNSKHKRSIIHPNGFWYAIFLLSKRREILRSDCYSLLFM